MEPVTSVDMKEIGQSVNAIKSAWNEKDYARVADQCRKLLEHEPENVYGLIYLARAARRCPRRLGADPPQPA
jgi:hypothetical protein